MTSIKVTEAATVFRGEETVYHYDFPAVGILEGWAIPGIKHKLAELGGELELPIEGEHPAVEVLTEALTSEEELTSFSEAEVASVGAIRAEVPDDAGVRPVDVHGADPTPTDPALSVLSSSQLRLSRSSEEGSRFQLTWFHAVIAVVVAVVIAASWWAIQFTTSQDVEAVRESSTGARSGERSSSGVAPDGVAEVPSQIGGAGASTQGVESTNTPGGGEYASLAGTQLAPSPESVLLETDLLRTHAPEGFQAAPENGGWVLSGEDSDLRIHLIVNRVFGVPAAEMFKEIRKTVESDPALSEFKDSSEGNFKVSYLENPGDGSQVRWVIWLSGDNEISVGCQTRTVPTLVQNAACSMVVDSTVLKTEAEDEG